MPSPSTNLSTGTSTKPTRLIPDYLAKTQNYVPLSVFFAGVPEQEADPDSLFGLRMPDRKKNGAAKPKEKKAKGGETGSKGDKDKPEDDEGKKEKGAQKGAEGPQRSQTSKPRPQASIPAQAPQQAPQAPQATAAGGRQESLSGALGRLLDVVQGKSVAPADEMTTTANVPTLPVPIGAGDGRKFLDRPDDDKRKKKKKGRRLSRSLYILLRQ